MVVVLDLCAQGNGARIGGLGLDPLLCLPYWTLVLPPHKGYAICRDRVPERPITYQSVTPIFERSVSGPFYLWSSL